MQAQSRTVRSHLPELGILGCGGTPSSVSNAILRSYTQYAITYHRRLKVRQYVVTMKPGRNFRGAPWRTVACTSTVFVYSRGTPMLHPGFASTSTIHLFHTPQPYIFNPPRGSVSRESLVSHLRPPAARQPQSSIRICILTQSVPVGSGFCRHVGRAAEACSQACALGSAPSCFRPLGLHALYSTENSIFGGASCRAARSEDLHCCWPSSQLGEQLAPFHAPLAIASLAWVLLHDRSISFVLSRRSDDVRRLSLAVQ